MPFEKKPEGNPQNIPLITLVSSSEAHQKLFSLFRMCAATPYGKGLTWASSHIYIVLFFLLHLRLMLLRCYATTVQYYAQQRKEDTTTTRVNISLEFSLMQKDKNPSLSIFLDFCSVLFCSIETQLSVKLYDNKVANCAKLNQPFKFNSLPCFFINFNRTLSK